MSVGIKPYLGTGLAEMLAGRRQQEYEAGLEAQKAAMPQLMAALAPAIESASIGDPEMLRNAMAALQQSGLQMPFGQEGMTPLAGMLQGPAQGAESAMPAYGGIDPALVRRLGLSRARELEAERLKSSIAAEREQATTEAKGVADFQKQALAGLQSARQRMSTIGQLRSTLPQADLGPLTAAGAFEGLSMPKLAEAFKSEPTKKLLAQAQELYTNMRSSTSGQRLFSQEVPTELKVSALNTPEQIQGLLSALEMGAQFDILIGQLMQDAAAEAKAEGRRLTAQDQADVIDLASELIIELFPNKAQIERSLGELQ